MGLIAVPAVELFGAGAASQRRISPPAKACEDSVAQPLSSMGAEMTAVSAARRNDDFM
jgi:hypothetical protein